MHTLMQTSKSKFLTLNKQTENHKTNYHAKTYKKYFNSPTLKTDIVLNVQNINQ